MKFELPPIYPITDKRLSGRPTHHSILRELIRGGARLVQIRDKETDDRALLEDLRRCAELASEHGVLLIVNDRCDLALCANAGGVHLGQTDLPPKAARRLLGPEKVIGLSTHTAAQARRADSQPVDYLAFGPIFPTRTKKDAEASVGIQKLRNLCRKAKTPIVAIGGIRPESIPDIFRAGAQSVAVISALMTARNPARRMEELLRIATDWR